MGSNPGDQDLVYRHPIETVKGKGEIKEVREIIKYMTGKYSRRFEKIFRLNRLIFKCPTPRHILVRF